MGKPGRPLHSRNKRGANLERIFAEFNRRNGADARVVGELIRGATTPGPQQVAFIRLYLAFRFGMPRQRIEIQSEERSFAAVLVEITSSESYRKALESRREPAIEAEAVKTEVPS